MLLCLLDSDSLCDLPGHLFLLFVLGTSTSGRDTAFVALAYGIYPRSLFLVRTKSKVVVRFVRAHYPEMVQETSGRTRRDRQRCIEWFVRKGHDVPVLHATISRKRE